MKIKPSGFLYDFLQKQKQGLTGHIEKAGYPFDAVEWGQPDRVLTKLGPSWWVYEQTGYWVDGFVRCAILLEDPDMLRRAKDILYNVLNAPDEDGYLGPGFLKEEANRWPHAVFFRACMALYEYDRDEAILRALEKHYLADAACDLEPYTGDKYRNIQNVEILLWLYGKTGNRRLLEIAESCYASYNAAHSEDCCDTVALSDKKPYAHGVSYNEYSKLGAILYSHTGKQIYLDASVRAYQKIDRHYMLIDGLHACDEEMWGDGIMESHETCNVSDFTWSQYYLFQATGNADYLEKAEKCVFNAGLGCVDSEFKALQYLSSVNQVVLTEHSESSPHGYRGSPAARFAPNPSTACCPGNVNRFMPNYILNMWQQTEKGVYLAMYGPSTAHFSQGTIEAKTDFPYGDTVLLDVQCREPFRLFLRIPKWADAMYVNGQAVATKQGGFYPVSVGCSQQIEITFTAPPKLRTKRNYAYVTKGPLLYALPVPSEITRSGDPDFPTYSILPNGTWNYGLCRDAVLSGNGTQITVEGYVVDNWKVKHCRKFRMRRKRDWPIEVEKGDFLFTPPIPGRVQTDGVPCKLQLVPYGQTMARIAAFPIVRLHG